ncbi:MAG: ABC transporter substrate-binding protein [Lachnospiraceae bacterium]|nr:ABC transporter substrate-binding protein [Lachnospiraceae bacterium]
MNAQTKLTKRNRIYFLMALLLWILSTGCGKTREEQSISIEAELQGGNGENQERGSEYEEFLTGSRLELEYAREFTVDFCQNDCKLITLSDGSRFLVVPESAEAFQNLPEDIAVLKQPISQIYLAASAVMDMFCALDALDHLRLSGTKEEDWYIGQAKEAMVQGRLLYAGKYNAPDYELILSEGCQLAIENTMLDHAPEVREKLEGFGIPVLVDHSSRETNPLGRIEWIKLYGILTGREEEAQAAFQAQKEAISQVSSGKEVKKTVAFFYITSNGAVNVRKPSDYIPKMIELAGGQYVFQSLGEEGEGSSSSVNLQVEEFYAAARDADILIYNSAVGGEVGRIDDLLEMCGVLKDFKAVQKGNVWCTKKEMYQKSMAVGDITMDFYKILTEEEDREPTLQYLFPVKQER